MKIDESDFALKGDEEVTRTRMATHKEITYV